MPDPTPGRWPLLEVLDHGEPISIAFEDLVRYHGRASVGGLALGFKAMERGLPLLDGGQAVERYAIAVATAFDGPGTRDAFEMVTRAVTGDRYTVAHELARPGAPEAPEGHFVFRLTLSGPGLATRAVDLTLRDGLVDDDFNDAIRRGARTPDEQAHVAWLKRDLATRALALPATKIYDAERHDR